MSAVDSVLITPTPKPKYFFENGLRKIEPYYHLNKTFVKGRWVNKTLLEIFKAEFKSYYDLDYLLNKKNSYRVIRRQRNNEIISGLKLIDLKLNHGDLVENIQHKHEPPVKYNDKIKIIFEDEFLLVIDKPSGIPVHSTKNYYYNTIIEILKNEYNYKNLYPLHRLDKLTSGILILSKNNSKNSYYQDLFKAKQENQVIKEYIAKVDGKFPYNQFLCQDDIIQIDFHKSFNECGIKNPKKSSTLFEFLQYDHNMNQSLLRCKPLTGRTHQIRIHLKKIGFPIVNDPLYGKNGLLNEIQDLKEIDEIKFNNCIEILHSKIDNLMLDETNNCKECGIYAYKDPDINNLFICLHSQVYNFPNINLFFKSDLPEWALIE
ncbi:hypothetical protein PACTADRAFT_2843 [Pachysolen tannophilus NRRL Y-2460]|uniref:Pseudouridine synthase n=1 Tax=Pachysolen tannophilus NRRL Y-2460 TaxID=669874 RepID=A0A1E4TTL1_PACTA|nr:hypothetical protein PACTADRAFT_2843 [Pachysolen tannophilus NRRL Y-2460]